MGMEMRDLAELFAPKTTAQVDTVSRRPVAGVLGIPAALAMDIARPALSIADQGLGALRQVGSDYPAIGNLIGAIEAGAFAAQGDPYYQERAGAMRSQERLHDAQAQAQQAAARMQGAQADLLSGIGGGFGPVPITDSGMGGDMGGAGVLLPGGSFEPTDEMLYALAAGGLPEVASGMRQTRKDSRDRAQAATEREAFGPLWSKEDLDKRRAALTKQFEKMQDLTRARAAIESAPVEGLSVPILVTALQQQLEPGLAVRSEDVRMLTEGALSGAELTMGDLMRYLDENAMAPKMVPKLKEFALRMLGAREDLYADMFENVINEKDDLQMTDYGLRRSTPFWESGHAAIEARDARRAGKGATPPKLEEREGAPPVPPEFPGAKFLWKPGANGGWRLQLPDGRILRPKQGK